MVPVVIVVSCGRAVCRRAEANGVVAVAAGEAACSSVVAAVGALLVLPGLGGNDHGWIRSQ